MFEFERISWRGKGRKYNGTERDWEVNWWVKKNEISAFLIKSCHTNIIDRSNAWQTRTLKNKLFIYFKKSYYLYQTDLPTIIE